MTGSVIFSIHINLRAFTKQDHDEDINEQEMYPLTLCQVWNRIYFSGKRSLNISH